MDDGCSVLYISGGAYNCRLAVRYHWRGERLACCVREMNAKFCAERNEHAEVVGRDASERISDDSTGGNPGHRYDRRSAAVAAHSVANDYKSANLHYHHPALTAENLAGLGRL